MTSNTQYVAKTSGLSTLVRPRFGPGMLLQHDDLEQLSLYTRELSRLMFRTLFGCGVMCGLVVKVEVKCGKVWISVGEGVGLDCSGDPVYVPQPQHFALDEKCEPDIHGTLWVVLCRTEKCCGPRTSPCASEDDETPSTCTRERDGFEIRVVKKRPECVCGCPEPTPRGARGMNDPNGDGTPSAIVETGAPTSYGAGRADVREPGCKCVDPRLKCYTDHYAGLCACHCDDCSDCDCKCILLALLTENEDDREHPWTPDHRVRRFVRPVLMRDPQVEIEAQLKRDAAAEDIQQAVSVAEPEVKIRKPLEAGSILEQSPLGTTKGARRPRMPKLPKP